MKMFSEDWTQVSQRHDLMIEMGTLEMALERVGLQAREDERERLVPEIKARLRNVSDKLGRLAA